MTVEHGDPKVWVNGVQLEGVERVTWTPTTPVERLGWHISDVAKAMQNLSLSFEDTSGQLDGLFEALITHYERACRTGSRLLARHRLRRHR